MAQYNIQLRNDTHVWVTEKIDREDYRTLRIEVARFVGELLQDHANDIWSDDEWRVDVTDDAGLILYVMHISAHETAATMSNPASGL